MLQILIPALLGAHSAKKKGGSAVKGAVMGALLGGMIPAGGATAKAASGAELAKSKTLSKALSKSPDIVRAANVPVIESSLGATVPAGTTIKGVGSANYVTPVNNVFNKIASNPNYVATAEDISILAGQSGKGVDAALKARNKAVFDSIGTGANTGQALTQNMVDRSLRAGADAIAAADAKTFGGKVQAGLDKIKTTAKEKPLETAMAASMLMGGEGGGGAAPVGGAGLSMAQPGGFGDVPSVEQSIAGQVNQPTFIPKGLFEETKNTMRSREEEMMMMKYLNSRGLV
jgi:hypothetical protein